jgi:prepilin-type N-terminal cleavage/methylation domain-containing protein/prepilin-type processing-associated H-X9-DG protein
MPLRERCNAFTLIELLVVICVMGILMAVLLPSLSAARRRSRTVLCAANLRTLGQATAMYLDENENFYFEYYLNIPAADPRGKGRLWWFGFEANGPGTTANRPLDKTLSPLAPYTQALDTRILCPDFPYNDPAFFNKFAEHGASYGYVFGPVPVAVNRVTYAGQGGGVVLFADGIFFESPTKFEEGFYMRYNASVASPTLGLDGYAHFRHDGQAQIVFLDGHVDSQRLSGPSFRTVAGAESGNLSPGTGPASIYGGAGLKE